MEDEIQLWGFERRDSLEISSDYKGNLQGEKIRDSQWECSRKPCSLISVLPLRSGTLKNSAVLEREKLVSSTKGI